MALPISPPLPPCDPVQSNAEAGPSLRRAFSHPAYDGDTREDRRSGKVLFCDNNRSGDENGSESNSCQRLPKASKALRASSISTCPERNRRPASLRFSFHPAHPGPPVFYVGTEIGTSRADGSLDKKSPLSCTSPSPTAFPSRGARNSTSSSSVPYKSRANRE